MRVAVFGGTGFVGGYLIDALISARHEPSLLVRHGSEKKVRQAKRCRLVTGDLRSVASIDATLEGCEAIIYCIGILREHPAKGITFEEVQYKGVTRVAESAQSQGIKRLLLMSANGVKASGTKYQDTKYRAEQHVKAAGFAVTIFRPSVIFGDPRGMMEIATQLCRDMVATPFPAIGFFSGWNPARGELLMSPVHVEDVALAFVKALEDPSSIGQTYQLGGPERLSWLEMLRRIALAIGRDKWILPMPIGLMQVAAMLFDWLPQFPVTCDQLTMLAEGNTADPAELQVLIGRSLSSFTPENLGYLRR